MSEPFPSAEEERLENLASQLDVAQSSYLQRNGWVHISSTPACTWMWVKEWRGKTIMVDQSSALHMQVHGYWS